MWHEFWRKRPASREVVSTLVLGLAFGLVMWGITPRRGAVDWVATARAQHKALRPCFTDLASIPAWNPVEEDE